LAEPYNALVWSYVVLLQLNEETREANLQKSYKNQIPISKQNTKSKFQLLSFGTCYLQFEIFKCYRFVINSFLLGNSFLFYMNLHTEIIIKNI